MTGRGKFDPKEQQDLIGLLLGLLTLVVEVANDMDKAPEFAQKLKEGLEFSVNQPVDKFCFNVQQMYFEFFIGMGWDNVFLLEQIEPCIQKVE